MFGDKIPKKDGVSRSQIHDDVVFHVPHTKKLVMEPHCEVMDLVLAQENIALTKEKKKAYEMNMHFENT